MDEKTREGISKTLEQIQAETRKAAKHFDAEIAPLFKNQKDEGGVPGKVVESSYLYIRSCEADQGLRPIPCPVFWLSPDIRVVPQSDAGQVTRELIAGRSYRLNVTLRNRGDLSIPSARVDFYLLNPTLGADTRNATLLGSAVGRLGAMSASELGIDYTVPAGLAGHFCLFARAFSFSPQDLPLSDYSLDPVVERHVAQQNLTIIGQGNQLTVDVIHFANAEDVIRLQPMTAAEMLALRVELPAGLQLISAARAAKLVGEIPMQLKPGRAKGVKIGVEPMKDGLTMFSSGPGMSTAEQAGLMKELSRSKPPSKAVEAWRALTATSLRSQLVIELPKLALKPGQALALNLQRSRRDTGQATGGVAILLTGG